MSKESVFVENIVEALNINVYFKFALLLLLKCFLDDKSHVTETKVDHISENDPVVGLILNPLSIE